LCSDCTSLRIYGQSERDEGGERTYIFSAAAAVY
jgi:hypothetical protein